MVSPFSLLPLFLMPGLSSPLSLLPPRPPSIQALGLPRAFTTWPVSSPLESELSATWLPLPLLAYAVPHPFPRLWSHQPLPHLCPEALPATAKTVPLRPTWQGRMWLMEYSVSPSLPFVLQEKACL